MTSQIAVLGGGMVGVCCALELQARGHKVTLIERSQAGAETSGGNAGVVARSSLAPFNQPALWAQLPKLLGNRSAALRYDIGFLLRHPTWALGFLGSARQRVFDETVPALDALIRLSTERHRHWTQQAGTDSLWRHNGWLYAYRDALACEQAAATRALWSRFQVDHEVLTAAALAVLEPALGNAYGAAVWVKDASSVSNPQQLVAAYANLFVQQGGQWLTDECRSFERDGSGCWSLRLAQRSQRSVDHVVVCLGPWSPDALAPLGLKVPMAFERGYHMHFDWRGDGPLTRPVFDTAASCVLSPMQAGIRLSTGVELTQRDAPSRFAQLNAAEQAVRAVLPLGKRLDTSPWRGARPTLPDSRPVIGPASGHPGLWLAFGHQHIGFSTGPGTATVLGALLDDQVVPIDARPFRPSRFGL
jgi:D-amino-acid dehydrogenase